MDGIEGAQIQRVIVTMGAKGSLWWRRQPAPLFLTAAGRKDFASRFPGQMMGSYLSAGVLGGGLGGKPRADGLIAACEIGLKLARNLHIHGYEVVRQDNSQYLQFPSQTIAADYLELKSSAADFANSLYTQIHDLGIFTASNLALPKTVQDHWTILEENLLSTKNENCIKENCLLYQA